MKLVSISILACAGWLGGASALAEEPAASKPAAPAAAKPAADAKADGAEKKIQWDKMNEKERKAYMKKAVVPEMKKLFKEFDGKKYASFGCATCHGEDATERKFKMPNPDLPKLPAPTDRAGFMALQEKKPEAAKFMGTQVKPHMAKLLGMAEWAPANPQGFGCYACHTHAEGGAAAPPAAPPAPGAAPAAAAPAAKPATPPAAPAKAGGGW